MERVLVVSAHVDDEMFGVGGTLLKHKEAGDTLRFVWFTQARGTFDRCREVANYFRAEYAYLGFTDQELDTYPLKQLISSIESHVTAFKPDLVYTNFIGDLNRDHRIVSEATQVACRPYKENAPKEVLMYYIPGTSNLGLRPFKADVTNWINRKEKTRLLKRWYPGELINGRERVSAYEYFERWPRAQWKTGGHV